MDFAYFQLTDPELKAKGIKIQLVFVHRHLDLKFGLPVITEKFKLTITIG